MPNAVTLAVLGGVVSAMLFLALPYGLPGMLVLAYFVQLPLMLVGLTLGVTPALIATVSGSVVGGLVAGGLAALSFFVVAGLPSLVLVRQGLLSRNDGGQTEWYPPGLLLAQLTGLAAAGLALAFLLFAGQPGGLISAIEQFLERAAADFGAEPDTEAGAALHGAAALFPGIVAASWLLMVVVNGALAQALAVQLGRNLRPSPAMTELSLPRWLMYATAGAALLSLLGAGTPALLGRSLLLLFLVPYLLQGLAVAHAFARHWGAPRLALVAFYVALILLGWPAILVVALGLLEDWAQLRRRYT